MISTVALFRALAAKESTTTSLRKNIQAGANVDAFCVVPSLPSSMPLSPVQLAFVLQCDVAVVTILRDANADVRCLLHWHFVRRVVLSSRHGLERLTAWLAPSPLCFASDEHGFTLLMYAVLYGDEAVVKSVLDAVSKTEKAATAARYLSHVNGNGETALHCAVATGHEAIALALVEAGASTEKRFVIGDKTLELAVAQSMWGLVYECDVNTQRENGCDRLLSSAIQGGASIDLVEKLVGQKTATDSHSRRDAARSLLELAVRVGRDDVVELLASQWAEDSTAIARALEVAIEMERLVAATRLWRVSKVSGMATELMALAVRQRMFKSAYLLLVSARDDTNSWCVDSSAVDDTAALAASFGQVELAALIVDTRGVGTTKYPRLLRVLAGQSTADTNSLIKTTDEMVASLVEELLVASDTATDCILGQRRGATLVARDPGQCP